MGGFKLCPKCSLQAPLDATNCIGCGHQYRTQFVPPNTGQTMAFASQPQAPPVTVPRPRSNVWILIVGGVLFFCLLLMMLVPTAPRGREIGKIEVANSIPLGLKKDELLKMYGEPDNRDRDPGPVPNETWTYVTVDGGVVVSVHVGGFVTDVWTY